MDSELAVFTTETLSPKRLQGRYRWTLEEAATIGATLEDAFRQDLRDAISAAMSSAAINANGTAPNVSGFLANITAPTDPTAVSVFADYASAAVCRRGWRACQHGERGEHCRRAG